MSEVRQTRAEMAVLVIAIFAVLMLLAAQYPQAVGASGA